MMLMNDIKEKLKDRLEAWELVEILKIPIEDILHEFEEEIDENIEELKEILGIEDDEDE